MLARLRHRLGVVAGFFVTRRWPWPAWRLRDAGTLAIAGQAFRFHGISRREHVWWAHQVRRGRWEPRVVRELAGVLRPGDVFFDLGAYLGPFSLLAARLVGPGGRVFAFEPDPATRALLERNLAANGAANVTVVPCAVGDSAGTVAFVASGDSAGRVGEGGDVRVPQVTLDAFCEQHGVQPTVMKVDIEGGEAAALDRSAVARRVRALVLEIHEPPLRAQGVDPQAFLERLGPYRLLEPTDSGNYAALVTPSDGA
jgi:FkbM family methyltransferase